jgi:hypothetical protein
MNFKNYFLLDFGGTHTKAHVWRDEKRIGEKVVEVSQVEQGQYGERTIDAHEFAQHVSGLFRELCQEYGDPYQVAITGQMGSFVLVSPAGEAVGPIISWQDERSLDESEGVTWFETVSQLISKTDMPTWDGLRPGLPLMYLSKIFSLQPTRDSLRLLSINQFAALCIDSELSAQDLITHSSEVAATGLYDFIGDNWSFDLASLLKISEDIFPKVTSTYEAIDGRAGGRFKIMVPIGDFQSALVGTRLAKNEVFIHIATGGQVAYLTDRSLGDCYGMRNLLQFRPHVNSDTAVVASTHLPAGRLLSSMTQILGQSGAKEPWNAIDDFANYDSSVKFLFDIEMKHRFGLGNLSPAGVSLEQLIIGMIDGLIKTYVETARLMLRDDRQNLVFSGGALNKLPNFMKRLEVELGGGPSRRFVDSDTSLTGLAILMGLRS